MKETLKRILIYLLVSVVVLSGGALFLSYLVTRSPDMVTKAVEYQLRRQLTMPVFIAGTRLEWKQGPRVILNKVSIDSPGILTLRIKSVTTYLSLWRLIFGNVSVNKIRLIEPSGRIDLEGLKGLKLKQGTGKRPVVIIWKGSVKFAYQGMDFPLTDLSGRITNDWVNLRARTLGGRVLLEADLVKPGKVTFDAYGIPMDQLDPGFKGIAHMSFTIEDVKDGKIGSFSFQAKDLGLPCIRGTMDRLTATAALSGGKQGFKLTEIYIKTPLVEVSGKAEIIGLKDMESWKDAVLNLEATSKEFDYEKVVDALPVNMFPDWLKALLTGQIRNGRSRFSTAEYKGPIKDLLSGATLMNNLYVVQDLYGQSFSAGHVPDRVTAITGQVIYARGDIRFINLSGLMGQSSLKRVDIMFPQVFRPSLRVGVDVELDMPAIDFIRTWRAAVVPQDVYKLLSPLSKVNGGRIRARLSTYYDEALKSPFRSHEDIKIEGCTYAWGTHTITAQSGLIHADTLDSPHHIAFTGQIDSTRIKRLEVSLVEPFGKKLSRFLLSADHLRPREKIAMEGASLKLTGTGNGADLKGSFELNAPGLTLAMDNRSFIAKAASARGNFKTRLGAKINIDIGGMTIHTPSSSLSGSAGIKPDSGFLIVVGELNLKDISEKTAKGIQSLQGLVDGSLKLSWVDALSAQGNLSFKGAALPYQDRLVTVDGPLSINTPILSSDALRIAWGDTAVTLHGKLTFDKQRYFKGDALIEGIKTGEGGTALKGLKDLRAEAMLTVVNGVFYGLPVERATALADLKDGTLSLSRIEMQTVSGTAKGTARVGAGGAASFDMVVSIRGADMLKLLRSTHIKSIVDGELDVEGRLWGSEDSLNGTLAVHAKDGEIRKYALVSQIFSVLNVYKIAQNRDIDFLSNHFTYNSISSTLTIKDNVVSYDDFILESNSIQISAVGKYTLKAGRIDAIIGVQPLESVDKTVSMIPLVGWVLTGDKGRFIIVSMKVHGTMDEPKVQVAPIDTLSNAVTGSLLRSLKLPARLIDESMRLIRNKKQ